jgi:hypothetical protein
MDPCSLPDWQVWGVCRNSQGNNPSERVGRGHGRCQLLVVTTFAHENEMWRKCGVAAGGLRPYPVSRACCGPRLDIAAYLDNRE